MRGAACALGAITILGSSFAASDALTSFPLLGGQAARYALAAAMLALLFRRRIVRPALRELGWIVALAATGLAGFNVCVLLALEHTDAATLGVIVGAVPVVLALVGPLAARRAPSKRVLAAAAIVTAGATAVQWAGSSGDTVGLLLCVGALACEAAFSLLAMPLLPRLGAPGVSLWSCVAGALMLAAGALLLDGPAHALATPSSAELASLLYLAVPVTAGAFLLWYAGVGRLGVERAGLFAGALPVAALVTATLAGAVDPSLLQVGGTAVVALRRALRRHRARRVRAAVASSPVASSRAR